MPRVDAVLFDFGDTLFGRAGGHQLIVDAARRLGRDVDADTARALWDDIQARARTPEELAKGRDLSVDLHRSCWIDLYRAADVVAPGMAELLYEFEIDPGGWAPFEDTRPVLEGLATHGIPVVVVSDAAFDVPAVVTHHDLDHLVAGYVLSYEVGVTKPDAKVFDRALELVGVDASRALMVGDNPSSDAGAAAVGIRTLLLPRNVGELVRGLDDVLTLAHG
ncbi:MAG: HAD family hydrolase [Acidimicrobiales bacterium]